MRAQVAANTRWAKPGAREAHAAKISAAKLRHHEQLVDPDGTLDPAERRKLARNSLRAEMARLALRRSRAGTARKATNDGSAA
jgi:hypothetical protein